ncbi:MAG: hypothetical protein AAFY73_11995 [Pseudomonadota bacterium]
MAKKREAALAQASHILAKQVEAGVASIEEQLRAEIRRTDAAVELIQSDLQQTAAALQILGQFRDLQLAELGLQ